MNFGCHARRRLESWGCTHHHYYDRGHRHTHRRRSFVNFCLLLRWAPLATLGKKHMLSLIITSWCNGSPLPEHAGAFLQTPCFCARSYHPIGKMRKKSTFSAVCNSEDAFSILSWGCWTCCDDNHDDEDDEATFQHQEVCVPAARGRVQTFTCSKPGHSWGLLNMFWMSCSAPQTNQRIKGPALRLECRQRRNLKLCAIPSCIPGQSFVLCHSCCVGFPPNL